MAFATGEESAVGLRGGWVWPVRRPVQTYRPGRVCVADGCLTVLSIYNGSGQCSVHQPVHFPKFRGRRVPKAA